jgi:hypothetical protein
MTKTLRDEIAAAEKQRGALNLELEGAIREHEDAKKRLQQNQESDSISAVTITHARRSALEDAIAALDSTIEQKRQLLSKKEAEETRQAMLKRIKECESESEAAALEYRRHRVEAHQALERIIAPAYESLKRWHELRTEMRRLQVSVGERPERVIDRIDGMEALHPFGGIVDAAISVLSEGLRRNAADARRKEAEQRRELAEQRETERVNALFREAAERANRGLRIGPSAA